MYLKDLTMTHLRSANIPVHRQLRTAVIGKYAAGGEGSRRGLTDIIEMILTDHIAEIAQFSPGINGAHICRIGTNIM